MPAFYVKARWDEEAKVYYAETNVPGLNIEADTLQSFLKLAEDLAPQMLEANHPYLSSQPQRSGEPGPSNRNA